MKKLFLLFFLVQLSFSAGPPQPPFDNSQQAKVTLRAGWNLISPPTNKVFDTSTIKNVDDGILWIFSDNKWTKNYGVKALPGQGFWVKMKQQEIISVKRRSGYQIGSLKINNGWNLIGMSTDSERVNNIISILGASILWEFTYSKSKKRHVWKDRTISDRGSIYEGQGFWLKK